MEILRIHQKNTNILSSVLFLVLVFGFFQLLAPKLEALTGSQFLAGRIIDDAVFYNSSAMSPQQIQDFLNSKVPVCDTEGTQPFGNTTRAQYGTSQGSPPPYRCLKSYSQTIPTVINGGSDLCKQSINGGTKSAAVIIADVSNSCSINPQVLLVLLQKEQSLVTDDWPWPIQYRSATGYGCPDTAPCDSEYYGFFNQVYQAAKAYRRYEANPANYNYRANRNNTILWHPNSACGTSNVFIQNQATASLYIYTPYRPNQAALDNLYGSGDSCSSYGNRNFWRMFNDWFGSTFAPQFSSTPVSASSSSPTNSMVKGDRSYITFKVRNTGNTTWQKATTRLGTDSPRDRSSAFYDSTWPSKTRASSLAEDSVPPGGIGTFKFWYKAPQLNGTFTEKFSVVLEGAAWTPYAGLFLTTSVFNPDYSAQVVGQGSFKSPSEPVAMPTGSLAPGEKAYVVVKIKNTGNRTWKNSGPNPTRLATASPNGRGSAFYYNWLSASRITTMDEPSVSPGNIATFKFWYNAQPILGTHIEKFTLVHEGFAWSTYFGLFLKTTVESPKFSAIPVSSWSSSPTGNMHIGARSYVVYKVRNTSNVTWQQSTTLLGTDNPRDRFSGFRDGTWLGKNRLTALKESSVAPGGVGTFEFWYKAPNLSGTFTEKFSVVLEGKAWVPYFGLFLKTTIINE